jgi:ribosomal protein S8
MNHSFIQLFNTYKSAVNLKKTKLLLTHSKQAYFFAEFLLRRAFISGISTQTKRYKKVIVLHIKYDYKKTPATTDFSIASKIAFQRPIKKMEGADKQSNFIVNIKSKESNYSRLLARIR